MVARESRIDWQHGLEALRDEVAHVTELLRSIHDPGSAAVGVWKLAEVAMHLSQAWVVVPSLASQAGDSLIRDMWDLADATALAVRSDPERDLAVLADRIEVRAREYFTTCGGADPDAPRAWLVQGVTVGQSTLTYHLLNETVMHGYDIAHAAGRRWRIKPAHAAMVLGRFIVPVLQALDSRAMVNSSKATGLRVTYDVHIQGGDRFHFLFDDGELHIVKPSPRRVDCHISADPAAFLMVMWNRQSPWRAIASGKLMAWGRKPWLAPQFKALMRNP